MKITKRLVWKVCSVMSLVLFGAGCAMLPKEKISSSSTDYNLVVEKVAQYLPLEL